MRHPERHGRGTHFSRAKLFELARRRQPGIGFTTVYWALTRLRDLNLVSDVAVPGADRLVYEPPLRRTRTFAAGSAGTSRTSTTT